MTSCRVVRIFIALLVVSETGFLFGHGGVHELIEAQLKAVKRNPADPALRVELAKLYGQHGELKLALQNLDRVEAMAPGKFPTDFLRGEAFMVARAFAKAKQALDRYLAAHPETARAWLLRARAEKELHHQEPALADYREALKRSAPPEPDLVCEVTDALASAGKKDEAAAVLAAGIEKLGKIPSLVGRAIDLEIEAKNFDAALGRIEQARDEAPRPEPWMARRATVLAQAGRNEEARAAWKELLAHLDSLPESERTSHAMTSLAEQARAAMAAR